MPCKNLETAFTLAVWRPSINCFSHSNLHLGDCRWAVRRTPCRVLEYSIRCSTELLGQ